MSNIIVTGAAGFIGSHITRALLKRNHRVSCIDDLSGGLKENFPDIGYKGTKWVVDCGDATKHEAILKGWGPIDTLVHCAANAREGASQFQPRSVCQRNLAAYASILSSAISYGVKNVVLFSSMAVYGGQEPPFYEAMPREPEDVYGVNKAAMEHMTEILAEVHGFNYVILRPHNVFGERQALFDIYRNVLGIFMNRIMHEEPIFIYGDGEQQRAFSYIDDSLPSFIHAIENVDSPLLNRQIINVGGTIPITVNRLADEVTKAMGAEGHPRETLEDRPCEVKHAFTTFKKSEGLLNYRESIGWEDGVRRMAEWALEKGPQPWHSTDTLEIVNDATPRPWRENQPAPAMV